MESGGGDDMVANEEAQHARVLAEQGVAEASAKHFEQFGPSASSSYDYQTAEQQQKSSWEQNREKFLSTEILPML